MVYADWFTRILSGLDDAHTEYAACVQPPKKVAFGPGFVYRFAEKSFEQALIQKLARIPTGLRASYQLISSGFLQEAAIVQRCVDELQEDVCFLVFGKVHGPWTKDHDTYLAEFWSEHNANAKRVHRPTIRDFNQGVEERLHGMKSDISGGHAKTLYKIYSGYAHASSPYVMEMFDGTPPTWKLRGSVGSLLQADQLFDVRNQYFRGTVAFALSALVFNMPERLKSLMELGDYFLDATRQLEPNP